MRQADRQSYIDRYGARLAEHGYSPETLGWGPNGRQDVRFRVLGEYALRQPESSVLDVGCGFGDLYAFLTARGWRGRYTGIDIVPGLLEVARQRHPQLDLREADILDLPPDRHDFVIASGVLNARLEEADNERHIVETVTAMCARAKVAVAVDFMSTYVDFQKPGAWHTDPAWALTLGKQLARRVLLRHDYMPFEFSLFIFMDDALTERNVFRAFEDEGAR